MATAIGERAISESVRVGSAILKFISPNDVGLTGGHQCGYYLPKSVWQMFSPHPPRKGVNAETEVTVTWNEEQRTQSRVKWYGKFTRSEYRLTRFGRDFPYLTPDSVGDLLVLIPEDYLHFKAYVLDLEEDIEDIQAALGVEITTSWVAYRHGVPQVEPEDEEQCLDRHFRQFVKKLETFPAGMLFSDQARSALAACVTNFRGLPADEILIRSMEAEYRLFRLAERQLVQSEIVRVFRDVDDFLATAARIMNRRKARAGRSLENHVEYVLSRAKIPYVMRPSIDGRPDVLIPSLQAYQDGSYPVEKLVIIGIKTTCKDRWRQVLNEARRVKKKHILTIQQGISSNQLAEMHSSGVNLIVPKEIQRQYPRTRTITLLSVEEFLASVRRKLVS